MHPYRRLPERQFWRRFVSDQSWRELDFMDAPRFRLRPQDRVATAGSCFAQHITRFMRRSGLEPFIAETAHPWLLEHDPALADSYGQFSARYGNVYTARQMLELLRQAAGTHRIVEDLAEDQGRWYDLLRPGVPQQGFASRAEAQADRARHLHCVRQMFEAIDVFVFTLGLTEAWQHAELGHTYPVCPGTVRGSHDPRLHRFHNFRMTEVVTDLQMLIREARALNPGLRFIFTVSPVPLVASYSRDNVLVASSYSKAVLRAAVGEVVADTEGVEYFPSYEIISHPASFGQYLASDLREVTDRGVSHVMSCFLQAFYADGLPHVSEGVDATRAQAGQPDSALTPATVRTGGRTALRAAPDEPPPACEEVFLDPGQRSCTPAAPA